MNQNELEKLVDSAFSHKPKKNQVYYLSFSRDKIIKIMRYLQDKKKYTDAKIREFFPNKKTSEIDNLKLLGILVENNILEINNKKITEYSETQLKQEIFKTWNKFSKIFEKYSIDKSQIKSSNIREFNARELLIFKNKDL